MHLFLADVARSHILSNIDARAKLVCAIGLLIMVLTCNGYFFPLLVTILCLSLCAAMRIPAKQLLIRFSEPLFIVAVLIVIKFLFTGKENSWDGLIEGLLIGCRIISGVSVIAVLVSATPFSQFLGALSWLRIPKGLIEISMFAYRCIFLLLDDAMVIYNAQKNRLGYSNIRRGFASFGVLAGSLTLKAFDNSQHTAVAMIQRGYDGRMPLTGQRAVTMPELACSALFLLLMGIAWQI